MYAHTYTQVNRALPGSVPAAGHEVAAAIALLYIYIYIYIYMYMYICIHIYICMHKCICIHMISLHKTDTVSERDAVLVMAVPSPPPTLSCLSGNTRQHPSARGERKLNNLNNSKTFALKMAHTKASTGLSVPSSFDRVAMSFSAARIHSARFPRQPSVNF